MKKFIFLLMCFFSCLNSPLIANQDLLDLFHLAVENGDVKLLKEVIEALLKEVNNNQNLLDALAKYNEKGKIEFALHNAIKDKNLLASVILTHHSKDLNTTKGKEYCNNKSYSRDAKTPLELALEAEMIGLIPYLLMKNATPYRMRLISFVYEDEENTDFLKTLIYMQKITCTTTKKIFYATSSDFKRNLIGDAIVKNRLDVIKILEKSKTDWNKICCVVGNYTYTPLEFSLATKRYDIAQFLLDHGAIIE